MGAIKIDDGTREFTLVDSYGCEFCKIYFRPADLAIMDRYKALTEDFDSVVAPLKDIGTRADGNAQEDEDWARVKAVEAEIIRRFNALLDTDTSAIFAKRNALSSVNGRFFCEIVLEAIGGIITRAIAEERAASAKRMAKYMPKEETDAGAAPAKS